MKGQFLRSFSQPNARRRDVLHRMVAHRLVCRSGVARPKIKQLILRATGPGPECDSGETGPPHSGGPSILRGNVHLDRPVAKLRAVDERKCGPVAPPRSSGQLCGLDTRRLPPLLACDDKSPSVCEGKGLRAGNGRFGVVGLLALAKRAAEMTNSAAPQQWEI